MVLTKKTKHQTRIARQGSASGLHGALQRWIARGASLPHLEIPLGAFAA
jgi:hypothetical protein